MATPVRKGSQIKERPSGQLDTIFFLGTPAEGIKSFSPGATKNAWALTVQDKKEDQGIPAADLAATGRLFTLPAGSSSHRPTKATVAAMAQPSSNRALAGKRRSRQRNQLLDIRHSPPTRDPVDADSVIDRLGRPSRTVWPPGGTAGFPPVYLLLE